MVLPNYNPRTSEQDPTRSIRAYRGAFQFQGEQHIDGPAGFTKEQFWVRGSVRGSCDPLCGDNTLAQVHTHPISLRYLRT